MRDLFNNILDIEDVQGVMLFSFEGRILYKELRSPLVEAFENMDLWPPFIKALAGIKEADLVFENSRLYVRRTALGFLVIPCGAYIPGAMLRLSCDMVLPSLKQADKGKGLRYMLKKNR
ncbi:MAG: hypothetical protein KKE57_10990 [Proteobacteria bacterium]|nr:hypothetical protein [Pseudomonadota bacterium]